VRGLTRGGVSVIEDLFAAHIERGWHPGAQLAIYRGGELVLDLVGGEAAPGQRLTRHHRMLLFSATKPLMAFAVLRLIEQRRVRLDDRIAVHWPEFAAGGKGAATLRHALSHRAGCPQLPPDFDLNRVDDWEYAVRQTASVRAQWEPGSDVGYHTLTFGWLLGELLRRVDGRMPRQYLREELFAPLGVEGELSIGLDQRDLGRRAPVHAMSEVTRHDASGALRSTSRVAQAYNSEVVARAQIPAANGYGSARALAKCYAALLASARGQRGALLRPETLAEATRVQAETPRDRSQDTPKRYGLGLYLSGLSGDPFDYHEGTGVFGHAGQQSSVGYADPRYDIAVAYVTNGLHEPDVVYRRVSEMAAAIRSACL
jgi:CubicO group peptidase (beta-lactamase class C family)